ncbi:alkene reductase [Thalassotalea maritima]|uniref:alkene reductase n=1 Tax=Thalassotalea maritima TaxID=3242416 RepID=UPI00352717C6
MTNPLLTTYRLNDSLTLANRIVMAPMTRCMADDNLVATDAMADYYAKRASVGLIVSEGTIIRADGQGHPNVPGIYTDAQIAGWQRVVDKVHENGGKIFAQLWHTGRMSHSHFHGQEVLAPSAIAAQGTVPRARELSFTEPRSLTFSEIAQLVFDFQKAAKNAIKAGFDGVEIHGANGYLIDQFLHYSANTRQDLYGGTPQNMARFALEVIDAVILAIGKERTAIRLSPGAYHGIEGCHDDRAVFDYLLLQIEQRDIAYVHAGMFDDSMTFDYLDGQVSTYLRKQYRKTLIGCGGYTADMAEQAISTQAFDLMGIGRPLIANPDYVHKLADNQDLCEYDVTMLDTLT